MTTSATPGGMRSSEAIGARIGAVDERTGLGYDVRWRESSSLLALAELHRATSVGAQVRFRAAAAWEPNAPGAGGRRRGFSVDEIAAVEDAGGRRGPGCARSPTRSVRGCARCSSA